MRIGVVGLGYVGLTTACGFAEMGHDVVGFDKCPEKNMLLADGTVPFFEPGLQEILRTNLLKQRISFKENLTDIVSQSHIIFVCVGTPNLENGEVDVSELCQLTKEIGSIAKQDLTLVVKSTLPLKGCDFLKKCLEDAGSQQKNQLVYNPEFLKQGSALNDFMKPDRIIVGTQNGENCELLDQLYQSFLRNGHPIIHMNYVSAELTKYAANTMLATRISFINELANLSEKTGADILKVRAGIAADQRIGPDFLHAGLGFGGSCLPKDTKALIHLGEKYGLQMPLMRAVHQVNRDRIPKFTDKIKKFFSKTNLPRKVAIWGLAFKPETDDIRHAPSLSIINALLSLDFEIVAYDPHSQKKCVEYYKNTPQVKIVNSAYEAAEDCSALIITTECFEFREPKFDLLKQKMKSPTIFDGRNLFQTDSMKKNGFNYLSIGR